MHTKFTKNTSYFTMSYIQFTILVKISTIFSKALFHLEVYLCSSCELGHTGHLKG